MFGKKKKKQKTLDQAICDQKYLSRIDIEEESQKKARKYKGGIFYANIVVVLLVGICMANDYCRLQKTWNLVEISNKYIVYITSITCALLLDVSMTYFGVEFKKYSQKLISKATLIKVTLLSVPTFLIPYVCYFLFTLATRKQAYSLGDTGQFVIGAASQAPETNGDAILLIAIFAAVLPLATSLFAILSGYCSNDFLAMMENDKNIEKLTLEGEISGVQQALEEASDPERHIANLLMDEIENYFVFKRHLSDQGLALKIQAAELIAQRIDTPEAYSVMAQRAKQLVEMRERNDKGIEEHADMIKSELLSIDIAEPVVNELLERRAG